MNDWPDRQAAGSWAVPQLATSALDSSTFSTSLHAPVAFSAWLCLSLPDCDRGCAPGNSAGPTTLHCVWLLCVMPILHGFTIICVGTSATSVRHTRDGTGPRTPSGLQS